MCFVFERKKKISQYMGCLNHQILVLKIGQAIVTIYPKVL